MQCSSEQCSAVYFGVVYYTVVQCSAVLCSDNIVQCNALHSTAGATGCWKLLDWYMNNASFQLEMKHGKNQGKLTTTMMNWLNSYLFFSFQKYLHSLAGQYKPLGPPTPLLTFVND